jgi:hypothetical protein
MHYLFGVVEDSWLGAVDVDTVGGIYRWQLWWAVSCREHTAVLATSMKWQGLCCSGARQGLHGSPLTAVCRASPSCSCHGFLRATVCGWVG